MIIFGFDGAGPTFIEKFSKEGKLPNFTRLMGDGYFTELYPSPPCDTPTNWATLMTGAWPGTHGLTSFFVHFPGDPLDKFYSTTTSRVCDAEYLWDSAERAGKKCLLLNWPVSWPPTIRKGIQINGTGPGSAAWRISYGNTYTTREWKPDKEVGIAFGQETKIAFTPARGWTNLPKSYSPSLESDIPLKSKTKYSWSEVGWRIEEVIEERVKPIRYHLLLIDSQNRGYDRLLISREKDTTRCIATLERGRWSGWLYETFLKEELLDQSGLIQVKDDKIEGVFKFKLIELSPDGRDFTLFRTDVWAVKGWSYPEEVADEINRTVGPFVEGLEIPPPITRYRNDWDTYYELLDESVRWYIDASDYLVRKNLDWDFMAIQIHIHDGINHVIAREISPGLKEYEDEKSKFYWNIYERSYVAIDTLVGEILKRCANRETLVALVSDHCAIPTFKRLWIHIPLAKAGFISYRKDSESGDLRIDWSNTKAIPRRIYIWVNLKGRDPDGIVDPEDFEKVREQIIETLLGIRDPDTGECPFSAVMRKEDAAIYGQWGGKVGDIIYFMKPGYTDADVDYLTTSPAVLSSDPIDTTVVRCAHHQYLPMARFGPFSNSAFFILCGPGVRRNYRRPRAALSVDVAPTLAFLFGIPVPRNADGKLLVDALEEFSP